MLSDAAARGLNTQVFRPDAGLCVNIIPYETVYWEDEWPEPELNLTPEESDAVRKMFWFRKKIWDGVALEANEHQAWNEMKQQVPDWALFRRLELTREQKVKRKRAERRVKLQFDAFERELVLDEEQVECLHALGAAKYWRLMLLDDEAFQKALPPKLESHRKKVHEHLGGAMRGTVEHHATRGLWRRLATSATKWFGKGSA